MGYGIEHTAELPVVGVTARTEWAELVVAALEELRATVDAKVTPAGIDVSADLSFRSGVTYSAVRDLAFLELHTQGSLLSAGTYPGIVYKGPTGELYYNDAAGNQVAITSGGSVAAAAGNISGSGYGSSGVEIAWVSGDSAYEFRTGAGANDFADLKCDDIYLNDGSANYLRLAVGSMSADYTLTFPAAVPATDNNVLRQTTAGTIEAITAVSVATLATSGAATVGSTLGVTGLITATAGLTAAANTHVTVSGTGRFKHGSLTKWISAASGTGGAATGWDWNITGRYFDAPASSTDTLSIPIPMNAGERITGVAVHITDVSGQTIDYRLVKVDSGTASAVASDDTTGAGAYAAWGLGSLTETVGSNAFYTVDITPNSSSSSAAKVWGVAVTYDRP